MKPVGATLGYGGDVVLEYADDTGRRGIVMFGGRKTDLLLHPDYYPQEMETPWPVDPKTGKKMPIQGDV